MSLISDKINWNNKQDPLNQGIGISISDNTVSIDNTVITTSNIGSQSVNYAVTAGSANDTDSKISTHNSDTSAHANGFNHSLTVNGWLTLNTNAPTLPFIHSSGSTTLEVDLRLDQNNFYILKKENDSWTKHFFRINWSSGIATFSDTPYAPTPGISTNSTAIATTEFTHNLAYPVRSAIGTVTGTWTMTSLNQSAALSGSVTLVCSTDVCSHGKIATVFVYNFNGGTLTWGSKVLISSTETGVYLITLYNESGSAICVVGEKVEVFLP